jgi:hypothetical protein
VFKSGDQATATIAPDGTMRMVMPSGSWNVRYRTHADTVWVSDDTPACANAGEGRYRWTFDGTEMSLTPLDDPCEPRLASGLLTWRRVAQSDHTPTTVTVTTHDYAFEAPDTIGAGPTTIRLRQFGKDFHEVDLIRLTDGHTLADLERTIVANEHVSWAIEAGGVAAVEPGGEATVTLDLAPGKYVLVCGVPDTNNIPHAAKGMMHALTVAGASTAQMPEADVTLDLRDYAFDLSKPLTAGDHVVRVRNVSAQPHMLVFVRLGAGKSVADVLAWDRTRQGPPPAHALGGAAEMDANHEVLMAMHLSPGRYALLCFATAPDGKSHLEHGMARTLTVAAAA